jgi:hypothetical protein
MSKQLITDESAIKLNVEFESSDVKNPFKPNDIPHFDAETPRMSVI